jgi:hypothetical protein
MCGKKSKVTIPTPAAPVAAPMEQQLTSIEPEGNSKRKKTKGKKSLVVGVGKGTGVNI